MVTLFIAHYTRLIEESARIELAFNGLNDEKAEVTKQMTELALREKELVKQTEKYADCERTLAIAETEIEAGKAAALANQLRLAQELADVEKAKAEQAAIQAQTKAEQADVKVIKAKLAKEAERIEAEANELENHKSFLNKQITESRYALHSPKRALRANSCWSCR